MAKGKIPSLWFYASRYPGRPCWAFGFRGRRYSHPDRTLTAADRDKAMPWFLARLAELDPDAAEAARARAGDDSARDTRATLSRSEREALARLVRATGAASRDAAVAECLRIAAGLATLPDPGEPADPVPVRLVLGPQARADLAALARRCGLQWGRRATRGRALASAILAAWEATPRADRAAAIAG